MFSVFCEDCELKKMLCWGTGVIRANEAQASPQGTDHSRERVIYRVMGKYSKRLFMSVDSEAKGSVLGEEMMLDRKFMLLKNSIIEK